MSIYEEFRQLDGYFYYIYKIINKINNKFYIGRHKTKDLTDGYMGSGSIISKAIKKYGADNFEKQYLHFVSSLNELIDKEIELVNEELILDENCYNISLGGQGDFTEATKQVLKLLKDKNSEWYNNKILKASVNSKLMWQKDGHKEKFVKSLKEKIIKDGYWWKNKKHKDESILKIKNKAKENYIHIQDKFTMKNKIFVSYIQEKITKVIDKNELDIYIKNGWIKERIFRKNKTIYKKYENRFK